MRKFIAAIVVGVSLFASPAFAIFDHGYSAITRLWTNDGFVCSAFYIYPRVGEMSSWVVTAAHCVAAGGATIKRSQDLMMAGVVNWHGMLYTSARVSDLHQDIAVGTVPDLRKGEKDWLWLADAAPERGPAYVHGFPAGIERISVGFVVPAGRESDFSVMVGAMFGAERKTLAELVPGTRLLLVRKGEIMGGSSGSAVVNPEGRLIGILWGMVNEKAMLQGPYVDENDVVLFTPVEQIHKLMKDLGTK